VPPVTSLTEPVLILVDKMILWLTSQSPGPHGRYFIEMPFLTWAKNNLLSRLGLIQYSIVYEWCFNIYLFTFDSHFQCFFGRSRVGSHQHHLSGFEVTQLVQKELTLRLSYLTSVIPSSIEMEASSNGLHEWGIQNGFLSRGVNVEAPLPIRTGTL